MKNVVIYVRTFIKSKPTTLVLLLFLPTPLAIIAQKYPCFIFYHNFVTRFFFLFSFLLLVSCQLSLPMLLSLSSFPVCFIHLTVNCLIRLPYRVENNLPALLFTTLFSCCSFSVSLFAVLRPFRLESREVRYRTG